MGEHAFLQLRELFGLRDDAPALPDFRFGTPTNLLRNRLTSLAENKFMEQPLLLVHL